MRKQSTAATPSEAARVIGAAMIGNALEFYALVIYGYLAITIAKVFFPANFEVISLLITVGTFGASYVMRPVGAAVLGTYADKHGRKAGMMLTIWTMGIGTAMLTFAPSYATIGLLGPIIVVCGKLIQGFSAGGEFGTSVTFVTEHAPANRRGFYASFQVVGIGLAAALASVAGILLNQSLSSEQIIDWGWRLPFAFGLIIIPFGYLIRRGVNETPEFVKQDEHSSVPLKAIAATEKSKIAYAIGLYSLAASTNYLLTVYIPIYAQRELHLDATVAYWGGFCFAFIQIFLPPVVGALSDRFGRLKFIATGVILVGIATYPAFTWMVSQLEAWVYLTCVSFLAVCVMIFQGAMPAFLAELFGTSVRTTSLALVHNLNFTLFGGMAPFICTLLIQETGSKYVPAHYVIVTIAFALASLSYLHISRRKTMTSGDGFAPAHS